MQQTRNHLSGQVWLGFCASMLFSSCVAKVGITSLRQCDLKILQTCSSWWLSRFSKNPTVGTKSSL